MRIAVVVLFIGSAAAQGAYPYGPADKVPVVANAGYKAGHPFAPAVVADTAYKALVYPQEPKAYKAGLPYGPAEDVVADSAYKNKARALGGPSVAAPVVADKTYKGKIGTLGAPAVAAPVVQDAVNKKRKAREVKAPAVTAPVVPDAENKNKARALGAYPYAPADTVAIVENQVVDEALDYFQGPAVAVAIVANAPSQAGKKARALHRDPSPAVAAPVIKDKAYRIRQSRQGLKPDHAAAAPAVAAPVVADEYKRAHPNAPAVGSGLRRH